MRRGLVPLIGRELIRKNIIKEYKDNHILVKLSKTVFNNFGSANINRKPDHDVILRNILIKDKKAIAKEIPVWRDPPKIITGHIDLIRIEDDVLEIVDYKPEGNFMRSIPQVAYYGYLLGKKFGLGIDEIKCISFNKDYAWRYDPFILFEELQKILKRLGKNDFDWLNYLD
ncbi:MAG: hypothetical protein ACTSO9_00005 [Candidatus Helarchaeota archaeon]